MNPLKVKIFTHSTSNVSPHNEVQINEWLKTHSEIEIVNLVQSECMARIGENSIEKNLSITVFYRDK